MRILKSIHFYFLLFGFRVDIPTMETREESKSAIVPPGRQFNYISEGEIFTRPVYARSNIDHIIILFAFNFVYYNRLSAHFIAIKYLLQTCLNIILFMTPARR